MTRVYFVRHAQPEHDWEENRTRPLTELDFEGDKLIAKQEHCHVEKEFNGKQSTDKK